MNGPACAPGAVLDARYRLIERLGAGGQGEVWRAHDATRGLDVALKVLNPALAQDTRAWASLKHEHEINRRLSHPFILEVLAPERLRDGAVLPMELAAGGDLRRLRGKGYLEIVPVMIEVALALEHAHERGVIHRDLKPSNVLFDSRGRVKLADFGIAELRAAQSPGARGSPFSASPEQLRGEPPQPADDIYGMGALIYELLSGYPPHYPHFDPLKIRSEPVPPLQPVSPIPAVLATLVARMLDKDPTHRPASMRAVIEELDTALQDTLSFGEVLDPEHLDAPAHAQEPAASPELPRATLTAQQATGGHRTGELKNATWHARAGKAGGLQRDRDSLADTGPLSGARAAGSADERSIITTVVTRNPRSAPAAAPAVQASGEPGPGAAPAEASTAAASGATPSPAAQPPWKVQSAALVPASHGVFTATHSWQLDSQDPPGAFPRHRYRWLWVLAAALLGLIALVMFWPRGHRVTGMAAPQGLDSAAEQRFAARRAALEERAAALEGRGAPQWGGADYAHARTLVAEASGAHDAGNLPMAAARLQQAGELLDQVEGNARSALNEQLAAGEQALSAGQQELALQDFALARRIDPNDPRVTLDAERARGLSNVLPLLASARNAETAHSYTRAMADYSHVLAADPGNANAVQGLARVASAMDDERFAKSIGRGFTALAAGQFKEARDAFEQARALRPTAVEPTEGLKRLNAAATSQGLTTVRARAATLEAQGRWEEAVQAYDTALQTDPSLVFARDGRERAVSHLAPSRQLQSLIDHPQQLLDSAVQRDASTLVQKVKGEPNTPQALRDQASRVAALLTQLAVPVHLTLTSDGDTAVAIDGLSTLGTFGRRDVELKPGQYLLTGSRVGYREVKREITVAPGAENVTINVTCTEHLPPT